jgi:hypothetical protein
MVLKQIAWEGVDWIYFGKNIEEWLGVVKTVTNIRVK